MRGEMFLLQLGIHRACQAIIHSGMAAWDAIHHSNMGIQRKQQHPRIFLEVWTARNVFASDADAPIWRLTPPVHLFPQDLSPGSSSYSLSQPLSPISNLPSQELDAFLADLGGPISSRLVTSDIPQVPSVPPVPFTESNPTFQVPDHTHGPSLETLPSHISNSQVSLPSLQLPLPTFGNHTQQTGGDGMALQLLAKEPHALHSAIEQSHPLQSLYPATLVDNLHALHGQPGDFPTSAP